jgi:hypothetical protein
MAKVKLNGKEYGTLWMPPFTIDVTDALVRGANKLTVQVTGTLKAQPSIGKEIKIKTVPAGL